VESVSDSIVVNTTANLSQYLLAGLLDFRIPSGGASVVNSKPGIGLGNSTLTSQLQVVYFFDGPSPQPTPEPGTFALGGALLTLLVWRRRANGAYKEGGSRAHFLGDRGECARVS
jgi:hypothetical protein